MNLREYEQLKGKVDRIRTQRERAQGALEQLLTKLRSDFGCNSLASAKKKLRDLELQSEQAKEDFDKRLQEFTTEWAGELT